MKEKTFFQFVLLEIIYDLQENLRDNPPTLHLPRQHGGVQGLQVRRQKETQHSLSEGAVPAIKAPEAAEAPGVCCCHGEYHQQGAEAGDPGEAVLRAGESLQVRTGESCSRLTFLRIPY